MKAGDFELLSEYINDAEFLEWATTKGIGYDVSRLINDRPIDYWLADDDAFMTMGWKTIDGAEPGPYIRSMLNVRNANIMNLNRYYLAFCNDVHPQSPQAYQLYKDSVH